MEAEQIYEVLEKLVGNIKPQGCSRRDEESNNNLKKFIYIFDIMHTEIDDIAYLYEDSYESSVKEASDIATKHIKSMGIED